MNIYKIILLAIFLIRIGISIGIDLNTFLKKKEESKTIFYSIVANLIIYGTLLFLIYNA